MMDDEVLMMETNYACDGVKCVKVDEVDQF